MSWNGDIYYAPEEHGLEILGEVDAGEAYEFELFVVWRDQDGALYYASDSGCSCPCPFEDYSGVESLTKLTKRNLGSFAAELKGFADWRDNNSHTDQKVELLRKVESELRNG